MLCKPFRAMNKKRCANERFGRKQPFLLGTAVFRLRCMRFYLCSCSAWRAPCCDAPPCGAQSGPERPALLRGEGRENKQGPLSLLPCEAVRTGRAEARCVRGGAGLFCLPSDGLLPNKGQAVSFYRAACAGAFVREHPGGQRVSAADAAACDGRALGGPQRF